MVKIRLESRPRHPLSAVAQKAASVEVRRLLAVAMIAQREVQGFGLFVLRVGFVPEGLRLK